MATPKKPDAIDIEHAYKRGLKGERVAASSPTDGEVEAHLRGIEERARLDEVGRRAGERAAQGDGQPPTGFDHTARERWLKAFAERFGPGRLSALRRLGLEIAPVLEATGRTLWPGGLFRSRFLLAAPAPEAAQEPWSRPEWTVTPREGGSNERVSVSVVFSEFDPVAPVALLVNAIINCSGTPIPVEVHLDDASVGPVAKVCRDLRALASSEAAALKQKADAGRVRELNAPKIQLAERLSPMVWRVLWNEGVSLWGKGRVDGGTRPPRDTYGPGWDGVNPFVWFVRPTGQPDTELAAALVVLNGKPQLELALRQQPAAKRTCRVGASESELRAGLGSLKS